MYPSFFFVDVNPFAEFLDDPTPPIDTYQSQQQQMGRRYSGPSSTTTDDDCLDYPTNQHVNLDEYHHHRKQRSGSLPPLPSFDDS